eukprot:280419_1
MVTNTSEGGSNVPSWLRKSSSNGGPPPPPPPGGAANSSASASQAVYTQADVDRQLKIPRLVFITRCLNIGICILMGLVAILELLKSPSASAGVLSIYLLLFSCLLCCFEVHLKVVAVKIANNFGFLFSPIGRICFLVFIGIICFSFKSLIGYIGGGCMCANALFNGYVLFRYPEVYENEKRVTLEQSAQNLAAQNSGAIASAGARYAANNPQVVASAVSSGGSKSQSSGTFV